MTQKNYHEIKITIADDHETFRIGLRTIFETEKMFKVVDMVSNGNELLSSIRQNPPDIILMDIQMPKLDGIQATAKIRADFPDLGIIALSFREDEDSIIDMIDAGANGYLVKSALKTEIFEAIVTVYNGRNYFCSITNSKFINLLKNRNFNRHQMHSKPAFTERELQIIDLTCKELTANEIAVQLGVTKRTVETHRHNIQEKMDVRNSAGIIMFAIKNRLLKNRDGN